VKSYVPKWFAFVVWIGVFVCGVLIYDGKNEFAAFVFGILVIIYLDWILTVQAATLIEIRKIAAKE
jgi:hypothetical protein